MARPKGGATVQTEGERVVGSIPTGMKLMEKKVWARLPTGGVRRVRALAGDPAPGSRLRPAASLKAPLPFPPLPFPSLPSPSLPFPSLPFPSPPSLWAQQLPCSPLCPTHHCSQSLAVWGP